MDTREFAPEDEDLRGVGRPLKRIVVETYRKLVRKPAPPRLCRCGCGRNIPHLPSRYAYYGESHKIKAMVRRMRGY